MVAKRFLTITTKANKLANPWLAKFNSLDSQWLSYQPDDKNQRLTADDKHLLAFLFFGMTMFSLLLRFFLTPKKIWNDWGFMPLVISLMFGSFSAFVGSMLLFTVLPLTEYPAGYADALLAAILLCISFGWMIPRYTQQGLNDLAALVLHHRW